MGERSAGEKRIRPEALAKESFAFFPPTLAQLAYDRTMEMCISHGFKPNVVQEAPQWTTMAMHLSERDGEFPWLPKASPRFCPRSGLPPGRISRENVSYAGPPNGKKERQ